MQNSTIYFPDRDRALNDITGSLFDPRQLHEPVDVSGQSVEQLMQFLKAMILIRHGEEKIGDMVAAGKIVGPAHLGIGQEAIAVGVAAHLRSGDRVFGTHRSHSHFLALDNDVVDLFAEVLGKVTGCSRGMGGSMHLYGHAKGISMASVPIVAATIPIAVGAALAAQLDGNGGVSISHFGDGAMEEGASQESLNLASTMSLPVVFVCENNLFASHMYIGLRQPTDSTARFAQAHNIPAYVIDGNDIIAVSEAAQAAIYRARNGEGPTFIEAVTYRWRGHVGPREDMDVGVKRSSDLALWKERDPIGRLVVAMIENSLINDDSLTTLQKEIQAKIDVAWINAKEAPYPDQSALLDLVYAS